MPSSHFMRKVLVGGTAMAALVALPAVAQANAKFGADLKNNDGSVTQPTAERNCQQDANPLDASKPCDRLGVLFQDTGAIDNHIKAPKDGKINKIKLVALKKGTLKFELGEVKNLNGDTGKGKIDVRSPEISYDSSVDGNDYKIQTFDVNLHVEKGEYLGIKAKKTSVLKCQSGSTEQLLFQPPLAINAPFESNNGHTSSCTLLVQAVYA